jgi:fluoride exporter
MLSYIWVGLGGAIGSVARFWISGIVAERYGQTFPFGTLAVNVTGSLIIGAFAATPITGTFANLPDGAILTANGNNFQASYEGGDGNDLTLTVAP